MRHADRVQLLHGPYTPPPLRKGDRATCLFRDGTVVITSWSDARISWPRCRLLDTHGGGSGLLVEEELARAVRSESSLAIQHWWGVNPETVWRWRKALGVEGRAGTDGSQRLIQAAADAGAIKLRGKKRPPDQVERQRQTRRALGLRPTGRWKGREWAKEQLQLLGKVPDAELAERFGQTVNAVRPKRERLGIAKTEDRRPTAGGSA